MRYINLRYTLVTTVYYMDSVFSLRTMQLALSGACRCGRTKAKLS